ncbi:hypothetical protein ERJ70_15540 [Sediminibacillus dalangtanensis]|uniref:IDEAL domain-containing protein n=1 Tax=Sediminibacillus dalangtanensis TaxID=2729421 RepID=A0ABX7VVL1_9BACI|nr:hypothetical protein [Sediminibacillus dalangtanensis]QTN00584.1 hypothetical protein ERJ70_15540 [Sediminibacillus dalangtanensis]
MKDEIALKELYYQVLKTCFAYEIHMEPGMTFIDMWKALIVKMDDQTKAVLKARLQEDVQEKRGTTFEKMLLLLERQEKSLKESRKQIG